MSNSIPGTTWPGEDEADNRWRHQLAQHEAAAEPLTERERELLDRQRRNPGVMLPELRQLQLQREYERMRREAAETTYNQALRVEDPLVPGSLGSVARRAKWDRKLNKPVDPHRAVMRPGPDRSGRSGWSDEPECIDGDSIGFRR